MAPRRHSVTRLTAALPPGAGQSPVTDVASSQTRLLMFGGKGGVGKTTCAAAFAVDLAAASRTRRVLLLSADPAHSVGDAIGQAFSDAPGPVRGAPANLAVRELNAERVFRDLRGRFADAIEELFARVSGTSAVEGSLAAHDRQVMRDLIELAPPGVDELVAIIEVIDAITAEKGRSPYDLVVMDTAPTGHALRLIEMPVLVHDWVKAVMSILLKYQPIVGVGDLGAVLLRLSQGLGRLRELMSDPLRTRFVAVTRPAALPRAETIRLLNRLAAAGVSVPLVVVNAVGAGTCSRCTADLTAQTKEIAAVRRELRQHGRRAPALLLAPAELPPPHGHQRLRDWRVTWRQADAGGEAHKGQGTRDQARRKGQRAR
jgi:arsenite-transporting ATPase